MAVDGKPLAGTVSMLTSKFKRLGSPQRTATSPELSAAVEMASLLNEAITSDCIDQFSSIGERMQKLSSEVDASFGNQASSLTETIPAFTWKLLPAGVKPKDHIKGCQESTQFYLNRILMAAKQKGETTEWPAALYQLYEVLLKESVAEGETAPATKNEAIVKPKLKEDPKNIAPKVELQGNRWFVEKGRNWSTPVIVKAESIGQGVIIEDCESVRIKVEGKVTLVSVNRCKRLVLEVGDIVSNIEVMSSSRTDLVLMGKVPSVILDSSEAIKVIMNEESRSAQILTSKCAEVNVVIRKTLIAKTAEDPEDLAEIALPFQFKTVLSADGSLVTEPVKHAGA